MESGATSPAEACLELGAPTLTLGALEHPADVHFASVRAAAEGSGGAIAVADGAVGHLWVISADGDKIATLGEPRDGPAGFRFLQGVWRGSDGGFIALDALKGTLAFVSEDGGLVRSTRIPDYRPGLSLVAGPLPDGGMVWSRSLGTHAPQGSSGVTEAAVEIRVVPPDSGGHRTFGPFPGAVRYHDMRQGFFVMPVPFSRQTTFDVLGFSLIVGTGEGPWIEFIDVRSGSRDTIAVPMESTPLASREKEHFIEGWLRESESDDIRKFRRRVSEEMEFPTAMPPYRRILADPRGYVWIERYDPQPGRDPRYVVLDTLGNVRDSLSIPGIERILDVGPTKVLALVRDSLDVESVVVYPRKCGK